MTIYLIVQMRQLDEGILNILFTINKQNFIQKIRHPYNK